MAQSLQKYRSPWLAKEESLGLLKSLNGQFWTLSIGFQILYRVCFSLGTVFLHRVIKTGLNLLFSEINFSCKVLRPYIATNVLFVKIVFSIPCIHYKLTKLNFTICSVLSLSSWWHQLLGKTHSLQCQNGLMFSDLFAFRKTKSCRQHALLVLRLTLVT